MATTLHIVLRANRINTKNEAPIYIRIIKNRQSFFVSTGIRIDPGFWDDKRKRVKPNHPNATSINILLNKLYTTYMDKLNGLNGSNLSISIAAIKKQITGFNTADFFVVAQQIVDRYHAEGRVGSRDKAKSILKKLKEYHKRKQLLFTDIDVSYIESYQQYARVVCGKKQNTIHKELKFMRQVFLEAIKFGYINANTNPFLRLTLRSERTSRVYLLDDDINKLIQLDLTLDPELARARDIFVFSCFACGLRISDVLLLKWDNVEGNMLNLVIHKTETQAGLPIPQKAVEIINKYRFVQNDNKYVFGYMPEDFNESSAETLDRIISSKTAIINKHLKIIGKKAKINKHLTFHVSRHSFATNALRKGIPLEHVQKLLGHANIRETQIYAKIVDQDLAASMLAFDR